MGHATLHGGTLIASTGQAFRHIKQRTHFASSTWLTKSSVDTLRASQGHSTLQRPHPRQVSTSIQVPTFCTPYRGVLGLPEISPVSIALQSLFPFRPGQL